MAFVLVVSSRWFLYFVFKCLQFSNAIQFCTFKFCRAHWVILCTKCTIYTKLLGLTLNWNCWIVLALTIFNFGGTFLCLLPVPQLQQTQMNQNILRVIQCTCTQSKFSHILLNSLRGKKNCLNMRCTYQCIRVSAFRWQSSPPARLQIQFKRDFSSKLSTWRLMAYSNEQPWTQGLTLRGFHFITCAHTNCFTYEY